jgi:hypothetical protein
MFYAVALLVAAPVAALAQFVVVPAPPNYAMSPPVSDSPLQQQILRNYRSDLLQTQRELAVQNPSGLSREQLDVTRQLNAVNSALIPASPLPAPTSPAPATATPFGAPLGSPFGTPLGALQPMPSR